MLSSEIMERLKAGGSLTKVEARAFRKMLQRDPAYLDKKDVLHSDVIRSVNALYEIEYPANEAAPGEKETESLLAQRKTEMADPKKLMTQGARRQIMQSYGPKPGQDTKKFREGLPDDFKAFFQAEIGEPQDMAPESNNA